MRLLLALVLSVISLPLHAQPWESIGGERFSFITATPAGSLLMISEPRTIGAGGENMLLRSSDRGETWQVVFRAMTTLSTVGIAERLQLTSDTDVIAFSIDDGKTWVEGSGQRVEQASVLCTLPPGAVSCTKLGDDYFACGEGGMLLVSDSTHAWREVLSSTFTTSSNPEIDFVNAASGIVSAGGSIYYTHDSALTWRRTIVNPNPTPQTPYPLLMLSDSSWLVGMERGVLASTTNGGASYRYDTLATSRNIRSISWRDKMFNEISIVTDSALYTVRANDLRSASPLCSTAGDSMQHVLGGTWPNRYVGFVLLDSVNKLDSLLPDWDGIVRDSSMERHIGIISRTTDGGATWSVVQRTQHLGGMTFGNVSHLFACGDRGSICRSDDSGSSWSCFRTPRARDLNAVRFVSESTGLAVGDSGVVMLSQNPTANNGMSGRWWRPVPPVPLTLHPATRYTSIAFADAHTVYVAGADSAGTQIWRTKLRDPMSRIGWRRRQRTEPIGTLKVYPNPATSSLHVEGATTGVRVLDDFGEVYDAPFTNGALDVSGLPPGVYFVSDGKNRARFVKE